MRAAALRATMEPMIALTVLVTAIVCLPLGVLIGAHWTGNVMHKVCSEFSDAQWHDFKTRVDQIREEAR